MMVRTPHIVCEKEAIARTVLMPGDPLRAKFIAEHFLSQPVLVNNIRSVQGYTGYFEGKKVTVMGSGMGMPSMAIYSHELYNFFDVDRIIRIGSAGGISKSLSLRELVLAMGACTDSNYFHAFDVHGNFAPIADFALLQTAADTAKKRGLPFHVGNVLSSDCFYSEDGGAMLWEKMGVLAVEMEAAALYMNASRASKEALAILTISDLLYDPQSCCTAEERETSFTDMVSLALSLIKE